MEELIHIPGIGSVSTGSGFMVLEQTKDGLFRRGERGVQSVLATGDRKVEFVAFEERSLAPPWPTSGRNWAILLTILSTRSNCRNLFGPC